MTDERPGDPRSVRHLRPQMGQLPPTPLGSDGTEQPFEEVADVTNAEGKMISEMTSKLRELRRPFPPERIEKLPKPKFKGAWDGKRGANCPECHGYHVLDSAIHLDYVGHANVTDRLLEVDPFWYWEPMALTEQGTPLFSNGGLWIRLTVCGMTRIGFGDGANPKEIIGDCLVRDTLILTDRGSVPIQDVQVGDLVPTRGGWRPVIDHWLSHNDAPVLEIALADGKRLAGTPHHRIPTRDGVKRLDALLNGDVLLVWQGGSFTDVPVRSVGEAGTAEVWNLGVHEVHEYVANGILSLNSIRNAAMRFGVGLDLWAKIDLHSERNPGDGETPQRQRESVDGSDVRRTGGNRAPGGESDHAGHNSAQPPPNQDALDSLGSVCDNEGLDRRQMRAQYYFWARDRHPDDTDLLRADSEHILGFAAHLIEQATAQPASEPGVGGADESGDDGVAEATVAGGERSADPTDTSDVEPKPEDLF